VLLTYGDRDDRVPLADVQLAVRLLNRHKGAGADGAKAPGAGAARLLLHTKPADLVCVAPMYQGWCGPASYSQDHDHLAQALIAVMRAT
jgi:predicted metal-dependent enzyme (double-stranded beta helix superfamily)